MSNTKKLRTYILISFGAAAICLIALGILFRLVRPLRGNAAEIGAEKGTYWGELVGRALGTRDAAEEPDIVTDNTPEDKVQEFIETVGTERLQIFSADVQDPIYYDIHKDNDENKPIQYAAMKILTGQAYYSVDMGQAEVILDGSNVTIDLPPLTVELKDGEIIDTAPAAVYQRTGWSGTAQDGINAFNDMEADALSNMTEKLIQDELLMHLAGESATTQVKALAEAVFGSEFSITVNIEEGGTAA